MRVSVWGFSRIHEMNDKILWSAFPSSKIMKRITAIARGRVPNVGYRYFVTGCARKADVYGFVKNIPDRTILTVAEGEQEALEGF